MDAEPETSLDVARAQLAELERLIQETERTNKWELGSNRLQRWRNRTATLLAVHLPSLEADVFRVRGMESYNSIPRTEFLEKARENESKLIALVEELERYGDRFARRNTPAIQSIATSPQAASVQGDPHKVFVVHGRNVAARNAMFIFLRALGLQPMEWEEAVSLTGQGAPYIGDVLTAAFSACRAAVILLNGDDEARLRPEFQKGYDPDYEKQLTPQPRPNVIFEAGIAFGRYPERTILVEIGQLRPMSDTAGRHTVRFRGSANERNTLKTRLRTAGCILNDQGSDWLTAGDFSAVSASQEKPV